ncbi:unnamed protein product, partial [Candidula unifasciata]
EQRLRTYCNTQKMKYVCFLAACMAVALASPMTKSVVVDKIPDVLRRSDTDGAPQVFDGPPEEFLG